MRYIVVDQRVLPKPLIKIENITKKFGSEQNPFWVLQGINLEIKKGELVSLLAPNGSGKTTLLNVLTTLVQPTSGKVVLLDSIDITQSPIKARSHIGVIFQENAIDRTLSVENNLYFSGALHNIPRKKLTQRITKLLKIFGLYERRKELPANFSGGMRRAVDIVRGILHQPDIVIMDEPTVGLDVVNRRNIWNHLDMIRQEDAVTMLMTTHYLDEANRSDRIAFLHKGKIDEIGTPESLITALGDFLLEITTTKPNQVRQRMPQEIGEPLVEHNKLIYPIKKQPISLEQLRDMLAGYVESLHIREPTLDDVYLWRHRTQLQNNT